MRLKLVGLLVLCSWTVVAACSCDDKRKEEATREAPDGGDERPSDSRTADSGASSEAGDAGAPAEEVADAAPSAEAGSGGSGGAAGTAGKGGAGSGSAGKGGAGSGSAGKGGAGSGGSGGSGGAAGSAGAPATSAAGGPAAAAGSGGMTGSGAAGQSAGGGGPGLAAGSGGSQGMMHRVCGTRGAAACAETEFCSFAVDAQCGASDRAGACRAKPAQCSDVVASVCACDNRSYSSACAAQRAGASLKHPGLCVAEECDAAGGYTVTSDGTKVPECQEGEESWNLAGTVATLCCLPMPRE